MLFLRFLRFDLKIMVHWKASKFNRANAGEDILHRPLLPKNVEKFQTGRTDMDGIRYGIGNL
jgi:hypothetical protein